MIKLLLLLQSYFYLEAHAQEFVLKQITISASSNEQADVNAPASITVVGEQELKQKSYRDLTDALNDLEGVSITGNASQISGNGQDISIRGMPGEYTLILIDGKRVNTRETRTNGNSGFEQGWLPPMEAIERIEVIRGPMSSLYGSDAIGGVVNVITKKITNSWNSSLRLEGTYQEDQRSGNSYGTNVYLSGPVVEKKVGTTLWGSFFHRSEDEIIGGFSEATNYSVGSKVNYQFLPKQDLVFEFSKTQQDVISRLNKSSEARTSGGNTENDNSRTFWSVGHNGQWGELKSEFKFYNEIAERDSVNLASLISSNPTKADNKVADLKFTYSQLSNILTFGGQWKEDEVFLNSYVRRECKIGTCDSSTPNNSTNYQAITERVELGVSQFAFFVEDEYTVTDQLAITGGLRLDNHEIYGTEYIPRLYSVYQFNSNFILKLGISKGYKAPSVRQILPEYASASGGSNGGGSIVIMGNPDLRPESSLNREIGLTFLDDANIYKASVTYFRNDFKDKLTEVARPDLDMSDRYPGATIRQQVNVAKARLQGIETSLSVNVTDFSQVKLNYTLTDAKITEDPINNQVGRPLSATPKNAFNFKYIHSLPFEIKLWGSYKYIDKQIYLGRAQAAPTQAPSYQIVDLGGSYEFSKDYSMNASVNNIFNQRLYYGVDNVHIDGRHYWLGFNFKI